MRLGYMPTSQHSGYNEGKLMANRNFASGGKLYSMHVMPVMVNCAVQIGASGAVSSFVGPLVASVVHSSTGVYLINLQDAYFVSLVAMGSCQSPSSGLSGVSTIEIQNAPSASVSNASAPSITIKCLDAAGALVNPASGSAINVLTIMNNSAVKSS